jgi:hypothetical protein
VDAAAASPAPTGQNRASSGRHLVTRMTKRAAVDPDFWAFEGNDRRSHGHGLFLYPAMMVPQLQGSLLDDLMAVDPTVETCYDPFGGSGTVLTECMRRGLNFVGSDLNPLAALIMLVKSRPLRAATLTKAVDSTLALACADQGAADLTFRGQDKWFGADVVADLCALRRAVRAHAGRDTRRFLWVCLAATVRLVCNSRISTFKLHIYAEDELKRRTPDVLATFERCARANLAQAQEQWDELATAGRLERGRYSGSIAVMQADMLDPRSWPEGELADVLMTSPPYGDNRTTVPYGQHAFLPLKWIDPRDLPRPTVAKDLLESPYRIDVASLGGRRRRDREEQIAALCERSPSFAATVDDLRGKSGDGLERLVSFCVDLDAAIEAIGGRMRPGAVQFWTLGDRRVSGLPVPTCRIVAQLSGSRGSTELTSIERRIPRHTKRMASRNDSVPTMSVEHVLVLRGPDSAGRTV